MTTSATAILPAQEAFCWIPLSHHSLNGGSRLSCLAGRGSAWDGRPGRGAGRWHLEGQGTRHWAGGGPVAGNALTRPVANAAATTLSIVVFPEPATPTISSAPRSDEQMRIAARRCPSDRFQPMVFSAAATACLTTAGSEAGASAPCRHPHWSSKGPDRWIGRNVSPPTQCLATCAGAG
jgi:hypothetical protein